MELTVGEKRATVNQMRKGIKKTKAEIIRILDEDETLVYPTYVQLKQNLIARSTTRTSLTTEEKYEEPFHYTYKHWRQICKPFLVAWLVSLCIGVTEEMEKHMNKKGVNIVRDIVEFLTGIGPNTKLHKSCLVKEVASRFLSLMYRKCGSRGANGWIANALAGSPTKIDWERFGVYSWIVSEDRNAF